MGLLTKRQDTKQILDETEASFNELITILQEKAKKGSSFPSVDKDYKSSYRAEYQKLRETHQKLWEMGGPMDQDSIDAATTWHEYVWKYLQIEEAVRVGFEQGFSQFKHEELKTIWTKLQALLS